MIDIVKLSLYFAIPSSIPLFLLIACSLLFDQAFPSRLPKQADFNCFYSLKISQTERCLFKLQFLGGSLKSFHLSLSNSFFQNFHFLLL